MLSDHLYPILEFDDRKDAKLNPAHFVSRPFEARRMIITFFPEVMDRLTAEGNILPERVIAGENPCPIYRFADRDVLITLGAVGCPSCAGNLDLFHAMGVDKVMFCGGGGVLDRNIEVGQLLLVDGAIRDEGFSYHYLPPSRVALANPDVNAKIASYLDDRRHLPRDARPHRAPKGRGRKDRGDGAGGLPRRGAVPGLRLRRADLRRRRRLPGRMEQPELAQPQGHPL